MKKTIIILSTVLLFALLATVAWRFFFRAPLVTESLPGGTTLPIAGQTTDSVPTQNDDNSMIVSLRTSDNGTVLARDFLKDSRAKPDTVNPGYYELAPVGVPYLITYISTTNHFTVELTQEPLTEARFAAETYLQELLDIPQGELCKIQYQISAPTRVNAIYGGKNLGFSFCPGATVLPQ